MKQKFKRAFTLVELLIVIALIAILSVAVLSTINPIEQSNKARDSRVQNDAAEVLNAYERYYSSKQKYPWEEFTGVPAIGIGAAVVLRSDTYGFGICSDVVDGATAANDLRIKVATDQVGGVCSGTYRNYLIQTSELKSSFTGKDEFEPVRSAAAGASALSQAMWVARVADADSLYLCYVPKAKANRDDTTKMRCLGSDGTIAGVDEVNCLTATAANYTADPQSLITVAAPRSAVFKCIPE